MHIKEHSRDQVERLDELIIGDNLRRMIGAFVDALDLKARGGSKAAGETTGRPAKELVAGEGALTYGRLGANKRGF